MPPPMIITTDLNPHYHYTNGREKKNEKKNMEKIFIKPFFEK